MEYVDFIHINYNPRLGEKPLELQHPTTLCSSGKLTQSRINYVKKLYGTIISALNISLKLNSSKSPLPDSSLPACAEMKSKDSERWSFSHFGAGKIIFTHKTKSRLLSLSLGQRPRGKLN